MSAAQTLRTEIAEAAPQERAQAIADDFAGQLDAWYSRPETFDNDLDRQIAKWYADAPNVFPKRPYFSPSSATDCPRAQYFKQLRAKKDAQPKQPHQGRWQALGTAVGSFIQRDVLAMERNMPETTFRFERTGRGEPMFEDFAKVNTPVTHGGHSFHLFGTCDGIMTYVDPETGEVLRVGLEIKSKQTTAAKTSQYSMRTPEEKHVAQCAVYSEMYNVDYFVILYVNASKKKWSYEPEEYADTPDIRAFGVHFTDSDREAIFDGFSDILDAVRTKTPPPLSLENWTFNNFKTACVTSLSEDDLTDIRAKVAKVRKSGLPDFKKRNYTDALAEIEDIRKEAE